MPPGLCAVGEAPDAQLLIPWSAQHPVPLPALANGGDGVGEVVLRNNMLYIPRVLNINYQEYVEGQAGLSRGLGVWHPCLKTSTSTSKGAKDPNVAKGLMNGVVNQGETRAGVMAKGHQQRMVTQSCLFKGPGRPGDGCLTRTAPRG